MVIKNFYGKRKPTKHDQLEPNVFSQDSDVEVVNSVRLGGSACTRQLITEGINNKRTYKGKGSQFTYYEPALEPQHHNQNVTNRLRSCQQQLPVESMDQKSSDRKRTALREKSVNTHMATKVRSINHTVTTLNNLLSKIPNNSTPTAPSTKPQTYLGASQTVSDDEVWLLSSPDVTLPQAISTPIKNVSVNLEGLTLVDQNLKDERRLEITKVHSKNKKSDRIILQSPEPAMGQNIRASPSSSPPPNPRKTRKRGATKFKIDKRSRRNYHDPAKHFSSDDVNLLL